MNTPILGKYALMAATLAAVSTLPSWAQTGSAKTQELAGAWSVVSVVQTNPDGSKVDVFGKSPLGGYFLTPDGHCSVLFTRDDLPKFKSGVRQKGTTEENAAVVQGSLAYSGTCLADGENLTMVVTASTFPAWIGQTQKRKYALEGDRLRWVGITGLQGASVEVTVKRAK